MIAVDCKHSPGGAKEVSARFFRPSRGSLLLWNRIPRTDARDYPLSPLPGLGIANNAERDQNSSRSANWIWRSRFAVSVMTPAKPLMFVPSKTTGLGTLKFA